MYQTGNQRTNVTEKEKHTTHNAKCKGKLETAIGKNKLCCVSVRYGNGVIKMHVM